MATFPPPNLYYRLLSPQFLPLRPLTGFLQLVTFQAKRKVFFCFCFLVIALHSKVKGKKATKLPRKSWTAWPYLSDYSFYVALCQVKPPRVAISITKLGSQQPGCRKYSVKGSVCLLGLLGAICWSFGHIVRFFFYVFIAALLQVFEKLIIFKNFHPMFFNYEEDTRQTVKQLINPALVIVIADEVYWNCMPFFYNDNVYFRYLWILHSWISIDDAKNSSFYPQFFLCVCTLERTAYFLMSIQLTC